MEYHRLEEGIRRRLPWLLLAGLTGAGWWISRRASRNDTTPGLPDRLVPMEQARQERKWTREALRSK
ncbi:MAG: hypothetical protein JO112_19585 [Planctomycetes bacterium]|nr:hypothetical protein [Planctomycetota bacterium]